jgi:hypothetical protein
MVVENCGSISNLSLAMRERIAMTSDANKSASASTNRWIL